MPQGSNQDQVASIFKCFQFSSCVTFLSQHKISGKQFLLYYKNFFLYSFSESFHYSYLHQLPFELHRIKLFYFLCNIMDILTLDKFMYNFAEVMQLKLYDGAFKVWSKGCCYVIYMLICSQFYVFIVIIYVVIVICYQFLTIILLNDVHTKFYFIQ